MPTQKKYFKISVDFDGKDIDGIKEELETLRNHKDYRPYLRFEVSAETEYGCPCCPDSTYSVGRVYLCGYESSEDYKKRFEEEQKVRSEITKLTKSRRKKNKNKTSDS